MKTPLKSHGHVASVCLRNTLTIGPVEYPHFNKVKLLLFLAVLGVFMAFLLVGLFFFFLGDVILSWGIQLVRLSQALYLTLLINRHFSYFLKYSPDRMPRAVLAQHWHSPREITPFHMTTPASYTWKQKYRF